MSDGLVLGNEIPDPNPRLGEQRPGVPSENSGVGGVHSARHPAQEPPRRTDHRHHKNTRTVKSLGQVGNLVLGGCVSCGVARLFSGVRDQKAQIHHAGAAAFRPQDACRSQVPVSTENAPRLGVERLLNPVGVRAQLEAEAMLAEMRSRRILDRQVDRRVRSQVDAHRVEHRPARLKRLRHLDAGHQLQGAVLVGGRGRDARSGSRHPGVGVKRQSLP